MRVVSIFGGFVLGVLIHASGHARAFASDPPIPVEGEFAGGLLNGLLHDHVKEGRVDYASLRDDRRLEDFLARVAATDPDTLGAEPSRLAFWINAYNAYTLKAICDEYPVESINDLHFGGLIVGTILRKTVWDRKFAVVGGRRLSLNHIEHEIIRPVFRDPRAHFALVCAAKSCPPLRSEAYRGDDLDRQLDEQGRLFLGDARKNRYDPANRVAHLSRIFDWYGGDFGTSDAEILLYLARFLPEDLALDIRDHAGEWKIRNTDYDWSLNESCRMEEFPTPDR